MARRFHALAATLLLTAALAACSDTDADPGRETAEPTPTTSTSETSVPPNLPAGDLPEAVSLKDVGGRTITAKPFADFAVAAGTGVWVSGVAPGAVRYDARSGRITARTALEGMVAQALEQTGADVFIPTNNPNLLLRVDAGGGQVRSSVKLPGSPLIEGVVGADAGRAYVLVAPIEPTIAVIEGDRVVEEITAPETARAVRAAFGSLWVPTSVNTIDRYDLESGEWTSIASGPGPRFLDVGFGAVWVMNQGDGSVTRVDGASGGSETFAVTGSPIGGGDLTTGAGAVWLRTDSAVARIDPADNTVTHWIDLPPGSGSVAATDDWLWITNHDHLAVHQVPLPLPE